MDPGLGRCPGQRSRRGPLGDHPGSEGIPAGDLLQARVAITDWKTAYNHDRPHSALGYRTLTAYAAQCTHRTLSSPVDLPTG